MADTKPLTPIGSPWASVSMHKTRILLDTGKYLDVKNAITKDLCNSSKLKCFDELAGFEFSTASRIAFNISYTPNFVRFESENTTIYDATNINSL